MGAILARHDDIITACITRHAGLVVKNTGDGIFAIFEKGSPLACCIYHNNLGLVHSRNLKDHAIAYNLYQESLRIFTDLDDRRGCLFANYELSAALLEWGKPAQAKIYLDQAINFALETDNLELTLSVLTGYLSTEHMIANFALVQKIAVTLVNHPKSTATVREKALQFYPTGPQNIENSKEGAIEGSNNLSTGKRSEDLTTLARSLLN